MIWLCIRGAAILLLSLVSVVFWIWALAPAQRGRYGTPEYFQWEQDTFLCMFGGFGLVITLTFLGALIAYYWSRA